MRVELQQVNEKGQGVPAKTRAAMPRYRGILRIREERVPALGRTTLVANLLSAIDDTEEPVVPFLTDATLLVIENGQLRVRGFELQGGVQFGQTWDIKVLPC